MDDAKNILPAASKGKKLIVFGAGDYGKRLASIFNEHGQVLSYYIDNCAGGGYIKGKPVYSPSKLREEDASKMFVFVAADKPAWDMAEQLAEMGLFAGEHFIDAKPLIRRYRPDSVTKECPYEEVHVGYRYAPWRVDNDFAATFALVKDNTLVDIHRLWNLWSLLEQAAKNDGILIEVGVWRGGSGCLLAKRWEALGKKTSVYLCDTFQGVVKAGGKDTYYKGGEHSNTSKQMVQDFVHKMDLLNVKILQGIFPEDTGNQIPQEAIAFAHIDVDVYASCRDVVKFVWPRLVHGGILVFDDYGFPSTEGVRAYLDEIKGKDDLVFIVGGYGQGIVIKK